MSRRLPNIFGTAGVVGLALATGFSASAAADARTVEVTMPDGTVTYIYAEDPCPEDFVAARASGDQAEMDAVLASCEVLPPEPRPPWEPAPAPPGEGTTPPPTGSTPPETGSGGGTGSGTTDPAFPRVDRGGRDRPGGRAGGRRRSSGDAGRGGPRAGRHAGGDPRPGGSPRSRRSPVSGGAPLQRPDGSPTRRNPTTTVAPAPGGSPLPGPSTVTSVPNPVIESFEVPVFLLPIYQAAGTQYGVRWEILAAINKVETDYGRNLNVSTAGAVGWMQFMPATWRMYGTDANGDGRKDPYNPVDAIFAAARYLDAAGYSEDVRQAIFAYNHADWYVDLVLMEAHAIAGLPGELTGSLTGLTEGRFPVYAKARYADDISERESQALVARGQNAANVQSSDPSRRGVEIYTREGAPVVAANDGEVQEIGRDRMGRYLVLQDVYGNRYTYRGLKSIAGFHPVPKSQPRALDAPVAAERGFTTAPANGTPSGGDKETALISPTKERLFAHPERPNARRAGGSKQLATGMSRMGRIGKGFTTYTNRLTQPLRLGRKGTRPAPLKEGSRVTGGTILGHVGIPSQGKAPHLYFEIQPAGRGAPKIDPKPILDGWKLLEETAIYRARGQNVLQGGASVGQLLLLSKPLLERRVLGDGRIDIYSCGRQDIRTGQIDRRVLVTLAYLAEAGLRPSVSSLKCGHSIYTSSGNVSNHASGNAADIAAINGIPILGHQDQGGVTDQAVRQILKLQGTMTPDELISLLDHGGPSFAMSDHADHIHVGWTPLFGQSKKLSKQAMAVLRPGQWHNLVDRLGQIGQPDVIKGPKQFTLPAHGHSPRASGAHGGE